MAPRKRKKKFLVKFELSLWGLFGVGLTCFCIFLWMFLLGVWAGQTLLVSGPVDKGVSSRPEIHSPARPAG